MPLGPEFAWSLSSPGLELRREEHASFSERLALGLRVGHGLGATASLTFRSGNPTSVTLRCRDPATARWIARVFGPSTSPARWVPSDPRSFDPEATDFASARRTLTASTLEPVLPEGRHWGDGIVRSLDTAPPGVEVIWRFLPAGSSTLPFDNRRWDVWHTAGRFPVSDRGRERPVRTGGAPPFHAPLLFWKVRAEARGLEGPPGRGRARTVLGSLNAVLASTDRPPIRFPTNLADRCRGSKEFLVSDEELVALFPTPTARVLLGPAGAPSPGEMLPFGRTDSGLVVGPPIEPDQGRHTAILGETGMGKSSLLISLAERATRWGNVVLFDPLGETAREFEAAVVPSSGDRLLRVFAAEGTASLNVLEGLEPEGRAHWLASERRIFDLVRALHRVRAGRYGANGFWGPRLEEMLTRTLQAASSIPGATLRDAHTLLATGGRTHRAVPAEGLEAFRELGERIRQRPDDTEGARRLLYEVVRSRLLERLLCDPEPVLHPGSLVAPGRITIVSGDAGEVGETNARYLLSVYLALVWSELIGRTDPRKTFVLLDEAQWFANESLAEMLKLGRRRNVHVVLATQAVGSLPDEVQEAVWTNVADFVVFRGSPSEARELERASRSIAPTSLLGLPRGRAFVLLGKGNATFTVRTARTLGSRAEPPDSSKGTTDEPPSRDSPGPPRGFPVRSKAPGLGDAQIGAAAQVLARLRELASADPAAASFRVYLSELRAHADPTGGAVRSVGRRLGRVGAIERIGRDELGSFWTIRRDRLPGPDRSGGTAAAGGVAGSWKPS